MFNSRNIPIHKYPRTHHIEGSRLQPGDNDLNAVPFDRIAGRYLIVEEKVDGANSAISFSEKGELLLQSRGHYLQGGPRERHFDLFKKWAHTHAPAFRQVLGHRYVMYGEWLYARHTIFYNQLSHYFMEFDILDRQSQTFLSTERRHELFDDLPIVSVKVLGRGPLETIEQLTALIGDSHFIRTGHLDDLRKSCEQLGICAELAISETDPELTMEGLYIKVEEDHEVSERYKFVRPSFLTAVQEAGNHWMERPIVPNLLRTGVDIFRAAP